MNFELLCDSASLVSKANEREADFKGVNNER